MNSLSNKGVGKVFSTLTSVATALSLSGVAYLAPVAALAVAPADYGLKEGDVVSAAGSDDPDVYIVNEMGYKRLFLNPAIFNFYGHLGGFAAVKNVSAATRDAFGTSGLFRNCETNDPKVYGVETTGEDTGMLHWVNTTGAQAVADDANFFSKVFCINNNEFSWYSIGADYTSVNDVPNYTRGTTVVTTGPVSVSLASSNPVSGTLVTTQARADLMHVMMSGNTTVTNIKFKRTGVSADASLSKIFLYDGAKRLTDASTVSSGIITFNDTAGLFTLAGSKVISVQANMAGTAGETVGVELFEVNGNAVSVAGNKHTLAAATLATVVAGASTTPSANTALDPADNLNLWQNSVAVSNRYVWLKSIQFRVIGSVLPGDLRNFRFFVDGVQVGSAVSQPDAGNFVTFDVSSNPFKLNTGTRVMKVLVDVVGGSTRTVTMSLRQSSDIWTVDSQYGAGILPTVASSGTFPVSAGQQTISTGALTITKKTDSPSGDIVKDASGVVYARFEFKAAGEPIKVENLRVSNTHSNGGDSGSAATVVSQLRNGSIYADGVQVGTTSDINEDSETTGNAYTEYSLGSSLVVSPGTPVIVEVRADVTDGDATDNMAANDTITVNIVAGSSNLQSLTSLAYTSNSAASGNQLTVKTGSLTVNKYTGYANQSVVVPKNGTKVGHFTVTAASSEGVNINTVDITQGTAAGTLTFADLTDAYIKVWNDSGTLVYTSPTKATMSTTASNSWSLNFLIPANKTFQVEVWGNIGSTVTAGDSMISEFDVSGITANSATTANVTRVSGQTVTAQAGVFSIVTSSVPGASFVNGGVTKNLYNFTITPTYDDYYLDELYVDLVNSSGTLLASTSGAVANIMLKDGSTTLATAVLNGTTSSASFTGLNLSLPQSGGVKTLGIDVQFAEVGVGANDTGGSVTMRLDGYKQRNSSGTIATVTGLSTTTYTGNAFALVKGYPTFTNASLPTTVLAAGTQTLFKTVVSATGGQISWNDITFTVASSSTAGTITTFKLYENGNDISTPCTESDTSGTGSQTVNFTCATERVIAAGGSITLELRATIGGTLAAGESISTQVANPSAATVVTLNSEDAEATTTASFVWSDRSEPSHSTTTSDWFTDGLVKNLVDSQSLSK